MKREDEIRVLDYLDGELTKEQIKEVESLIEGNEEAKSFLDSMKLVNIQLENEFSSPSHLAAEERIKQQFTKEESYFWSLFSLNNGVVAALSICLTILVAPNFFQSSIGLDETTFTRDMVLKKRGSSLKQDLNIYPQLIDYDQLVIELIESKKRRAIFKISASEEVELVIEEAFQRKDKKFYFGYINNYENKDNKRMFSAVQGETTEVLWKD